MNVCALDVVSRTPDFESIAATLELRGWEWDLLHDVDGVTPLGEVARRRGIDLDAAIGLVHEAAHRGLLTIGTMSLAAYRQLAPMQPAFAAAPRTLSLGTSAAAAPRVEPAVVAAPIAAPPPIPPPPAPAASTGAISFSSDAFDWDAPEPVFDEPEAETPAAFDAPVASVAAHDDHVAAAPVDEEPSPLVFEEPAASAHEEPVGVVHYDDRFGIEHENGPFASPTVGHVDDPFAAAAASLPPEPEPEHAPTPEPAPFGYVHDDDPFAVASHELDHHAPAVDDPFAPSPRAYYAFTAPEAATAPSTNGKPASAGVAPSHNGTAHVEHEPPTHPEPTQPEPVFAAVEKPAVIDEPAPGSISFSFAPGDPIDAHEAPLESSAPRVATPASAPAPEPIAHAEGPAPVPHDQPDPLPSTTQSTFYEREAVENDAGRELQEKAKTWKESLSWREQQQLHEAMETGKEKSGVIGSILRALGVR